MSYQKGIVLIIGGLLLISAGGFGLQMSEEEETTYTYTISTESVETYDKSEANEISELDESERELLKEAFGNSANFFDGSSTSIQREEKVHTQLDWDVIEVDGAPLIVSISEESQVQASSEYLFSMTGIIFGVFMFCVGIGILHSAKWSKGISRHSVRRIDLRDL